MDAYQAELAAFIASHYDVAPLRLLPAPRGFFGETWRLETARGPLFVKLDRWAYHKAFYAASFPVMERMLQSGIDFIPAIQKGRNGALCFPFSDGILGVFEYIEGENTENYPLSELFSRLARVYQVDTNGLPLEQENFSAPALREYHGLIGGLRPSEPLDAAVLQVLHAHAGMFLHMERRLLLFAQICARAPFPLFLTHGDAGGNCIIGPRGFIIMDWDHPVLAPPERDAWFFLHEPAQLHEIEQALARQGVVCALSPARLAYYCYHSFFHYFCEHIKTLFCASAGRREELFQTLIAGFFSSWFFVQLRAADTIEPRDPDAPPAI